MKIILTTENSKVRYVGDGVKTVFTYDFDPIKLDYVKVYKNLFEVVSPDVTVEESQVTFAASPEAGDTIVIIRENPLTYPESITSKGIISSDSIDNALVEVVGQIQQLDEKLSRVPMYPKDTSLTGEDIFSIFNQNVEDVKNAKEEVESKVEEINQAVSSGLTDIEETTSSGKSEITTEKNKAISDIQTTTSELIEQAEDARDAAALSESEAESWAIGSIEERPEGSAKYWADQLNDSNIVHKMGDENVDGLKTFYRQVNRKISEIDLSQAPAENIYPNLMIGFTEDGTQVSYNGLQQSANTNNLSNRMGVSRKVNDTYNYASINVTMTPEGKSFTTFPSPEATSSTTENKGATTGWVNDPSKSTNVVHRSGNEVISGIKTFTERSDTVMASDNEARIFVSSTSWQSGTQQYLPWQGWYYDNTLDGNHIVARMGGYRSAAGDRHTAWIQAWYNGVAAEVALHKNANSAWLSCPTPPISDNAATAITSSWFNQKMQVVSSLPSNPDSNVFYFSQS